MVTESDDSFSVYSYTVETEEMNTYHHWSDGLYMIIVKYGISMELNGDELKKLVASLPRTIGGIY